jgi:hypothetical protein
MELIVPPLSKFRQLKRLERVSYPQIRTVPWTVFVRVSRPVENFKLPVAGAGFHPEPI